MNDKILEFIKLSFELLSNKNLHKMVPIILEDLHILIEPDFNDNKGNEAKYF